MTAALEGTFAGDQHCVAYVRLVADLPPTSQWRRGAHVRSSSPPLPEGTPIATFGASGRYENRTDQTSHCAILVAVRVDGLQVWDQWLGQPIHQRLIRFQGRNAKPVNDGDAYYTIDVAEVAL